MSSPRPLSVPPGVVVGQAHSTDWLVWYDTARPARRCRPPLAHGSQVVSRCSTTRSPFASRRFLLAGRRRPARGRGLPLVDHAAVAPRVARDRPFRACGSLAARGSQAPRSLPVASLRSATPARSPFRAQMHVPSTPAGKREGLRGVAAHPPRFLRWPLAPGGLAARGWLARDR